MKKISAIIIFCLCICGGCQPPPQAPAWEQLKIKDLAPAKHSAQADKAIESRLQFSVYVISVPADHFDDAKNIWTTAFTKSIRFNNAPSFRQNGFAAGSGRTSEWEPIAKQLNATKAKNLKTVSLMMFDNGSDNISLLQINAEKNIFYTVEGNQVNGVTLGPGEAILRLKAATVPGLRGFCNLTVEPVFKNAPKPDAASAGSEEITFNAVSLTAGMSDGDFVLLGPAAYSPHDMTLSNIFFSLPDQSAVQLYLIVCTGVNN